MDNEYQGPTTAKIPSDVDQPDRVVLNLTVRQAGILAATAVVLYTLFEAFQPLVPPMMFLAVAALILAAVAVAVTVRRDALSLDQLGLAALRHATSPSRQVLAPEGIGQPPAFLAQAMARSEPSPAPFVSPVQRVTDGGVLDLGRDGASMLASCSTVNFALRTPAEQEVLLAGFARWLNALTGPVQVSSSSAPVDMSGAVAALRAAAPALPHPALEAAAMEHTGFLAQLSAGGQLLDRTVLLAVHEDGTEPGPRLGRRAAEAAGQLVACEIDVRPLPAPEATDVLAAALNPTVPRYEDGA
jgi:hypothetical protein